MMEAEKSLTKNREGLKSSEEINDSDFKGYNLDEIKYQRALLALRKEFAKEKVMEDLAAIRKRLPFQGGNSDNKGGLRLPGAKGVLGRVMGGLGYVDYFILGFSVINAGRKIFSFFRKNKK